MTCPSFWHPTASSPAAPLRVSQYQFDGNDPDSDFDLLDEIHVQTEEWRLAGKPLSALPDWAPMLVAAADYGNVVAAEGHGRYLQSTGARADADLARVVTLCTRAAATTHAAIAADALASHGSTANRLNRRLGWTNTAAPLLAALDERFMDAERHQPLTSLLAGWIRQQPGLTVVPTL